MFPFYYLATVTDTQDPEGLARVQVKHSGDRDSVTDWIPVLTPCAGNGRGFFSLPPLGSQVLVLVLDNSQFNKIVVGRLWSHSEKPPETGENPDADLNRDGKNSLSYVKTHSGNMLIFDDTEGKEKVQIIAQGSRIELLPAEEKISLTTEHDLAVHAKGRLSLCAGEIEIESEKDIHLGGKGISVSAEKDFLMSADKDLNIKGSSIALN